MGMFGEGNGGGVWSLAASQVTGAATQTVSVTGLVGIRFRVEIMTPATGLGAIEYLYLRLNDVAAGAAYPRSHGYGVATTGVVSGQAHSVTYISFTGTATSGATGIIRIIADVMCDPATAVGSARCLYSDTVPGVERQFLMTTRLATASIGAVGSIQLISSVAAGIPAGTRINVYQSLV